MSDVTDARAMQRAHNEDKRAQHGWGSCDHPCCARCAGPGERVVPSSQCEEGRGYPPSLLPKGSRVEGPAGQGVVTDVTSDRRIVRWDHDGKERAEHPFNLRQPGK